MPTTFLKSVGYVHLCNCGQLWTLQWEHNAWEPIKMWVKVDPSTLTTSETK